MRLYIYANLLRHAVKWQKYAITDNKRKAEVLNSHSKSVFTVEPNELPPEKESGPHTPMANINIKLLVDLYNLVLCGKAQLPIHRRKCQRTRLNLFLHQNLQSVSGVSTFLASLKAVLPQLNHLVHIYILNS